MSSDLYITDLPSVAAGGADLTDASEIRQWVVALYFAMTTVTTVGYGDITAHSTVEQVDISRVCPSAVHTAPYCLHRFAFTCHDQAGICANACLLPFLLDLLPTSSNVMVNPPLAFWHLDLLKSSCTCPHDVCVTSPCIISIFCSASLLQLCSHHHRLHHALQHCVTSSKKSTSTWQPTGPISEMPREDGKDWQA